jgi:hypothetical protein
MRRTYNSKGLKHVFGIEFFGCAHINQEDLSVAVNNRVLRFNVSVDDVIHMQVFNSQQHAAEIVPGYRFVEGGHLTNNFEHLFALQILHQQKDVLFVVEGFDETHDEREYRFLQNLFLLYYTGLHLFLPHCFL